MHHDAESSRDTALAFSSPIYHLSHTPSLTCTHAEVLDMCVIVIVRILSVNMCSRQYFVFISKAVSLTTGYRL